VRRRRNTSNANGERGIVILLVAVFLLFVVGAMAVLAIDVVTFYTARSETQLAADGAALAAARVLANSGATSVNNPSVQLLAQSLATSTAMQVAAQNKIGGKPVNSTADVVVNYSAGLGGDYNPRVQVTVTRTDLPTFFARIFGQTQLTVSRSAIAEAYNPSGTTVSLGTGGPIAPVCVKPWLLPNVDPTGGGGAIFNPSGAIIDPTLVGKTWNGLASECSGDCSGGISPVAAGQYYPAAYDVAGADPQAFPVPTQSLPTGSAGFNSYQLAVAGCVPRPISCGTNADFKIDSIGYGPTRDADTVQAARILIHDNAADGDSDSIDPASSTVPFQFVAGIANPITNAIGQKVMISDSLVTVPVFKSGGVGTAVASPVQVVGFLQLFLNPLGNTIAGTTVPATIINMAGCGETAAGQPVLGTGTSAIPVRLVAQSP
jgi:Flp pilus assembly protein TadG